MAATHFIDLGDLTLRYAVEGPAHGDPVVFIHALGCDQDLWSGIADELCSRHRVIRYDLRGHGLSDCGLAEYTVEDHARDLDQLLAKLAVAQATIIGASVGGLIAQAFARLHPERVSRLVLCATGARLGSPESWSERIAQVRADGLEGVADHILGRWFAPGFSAREPALHRGCRNRLVRTPVEGYLATCAALRDADLRDTAATIRVPTLVISGECDIAAPPERGRELAGLLPAATFAMIPGAGHLPSLENPAAVLALLVPFLNSHP